MTLQNAILDTVDDLKLDDVDKDIVNENVSFKSYISLLVKITKELASFYSLEETTVHAIQDESEMKTFWTELSGFLREFGCDYSCLMDGSLEERFGTFKNRLVLIYFLLSELQTVRLLSTSSSRSLAPLTAAGQSTESSSTKKTAIINESDVAAHLKKACQALAIGRPPGNVTSERLFNNLGAKTKAAIESAPPNHISEAVLKPTVQLSANHWSLIEKLIHNLNSEYQTRRQTLLKRFDCTVQSFKWSDKGKVKSDAIMTVFRPIRQSIPESISIGIPHLLAARIDPLLILHKTSSGTAREATKCVLNKIKMGTVPDRGGRAWELDPPPPEMPAFQKRDNSAPQRGGGGGDRGGRRGGRPHSGRGDYNGHQSFNQNREGASFYQDQNDKNGFQFDGNQHYSGGSGFVFQEYSNSNRGGGGRRGRGGGGRGRY